MAARPCGGASRDRPARRPGPSPFRLRSGHAPASVKPRPYPGTDRRPGSLILTPPEPRGTAGPALPAGPGTRRARRATADRPSPQVRTTRLHGHTHHKWGLTPMATPDQPDKTGRGTGCPVRPRDTPRPPRRRARRPMRHRVRHPARRPPRPYPRRPAARRPGPWRRRPPPGVARRSARRPGCRRARAIPVCVSWRHSTARKGGTHRPARSTETESDQSRPNVVTIGPFRSECKTLSGTREPGSRPRSAVRGRAASRPRGWRAPRWARAARRSGRPRPWARRRGRRRSPRRCAAR